MSTSGGRTCAQLRSRSSLCPSQRPSARWLAASPSNTKRAQWSASSIPAIWGSGEVARWRCAGGSAGVVTGSVRSSSDYFHHVKHFPPCGTCPRHERLLPSCCTSRLCNCAGVLRCEVLRQAAFSLSLSDRRQPTCCDTSARLLHSPALPPTARWRWQGALSV